MRRSSLFLSATLFTVLLGLFGAQGTLSAIAAAPGVDESLDFASAHPVLAALNPLMNRMLPPANPNFQVADIPAGTSPGFTTVADLNGDGHPDLIVLNAGLAELLVLLGNGDGTFQPAIPIYPNAGFPTQVVVGDFNEDGIPDLAVSSSISTANEGAISILLGNGDGTFQPPLTFATNGEAASLVAGDFDGDGHLDVIVGSTSALHDDYLSFFPGRGNGTFGPRRDKWLPREPLWLTSADFNRDGNLDLAIIQDRHVRVLLGDGEGNFNLVASYKAGYQPAYITNADLNNDGIPDLVVATTCEYDIPEECGQYMSFLSTISAYLGNGDGTFGPREVYGSGDLTNNVQVADFNGDGFPDLVANSQCGGECLERSKHTPGMPTCLDCGYISIFYNTGSGTFNEGASVQLGFAPTWVAAGQLHGNAANSSDIVAPQADSYTTVGVLLNEAATRIEFYSQPNPSKVGQKVTFTTQVSALLSGQPYPTGTVTLSSGGRQTVVPLNVQGIATFSLVFHHAGSYTVAASYSGDSTFNPNTATPITQVVVQ